METLVIDRHDIRRLVEHVGVDTLMREMIESLGDTFADVSRGELTTPKRTGFSYHRPQLGLVEWMPTMRAGGPICVKLVGYHPSNPASLNLPTVLSTVSLYDTRNGHLLGLADATFLTALRTGAASAVASRWLARSDSQVLGLIGAGAQAISQAHAISLAFPSLEEVIYCDVDESISETLANRLAPLDLKASLQASSLQEITTR